MNHRRAHLPLAGKFALQQTPPMQSRKIGWLMLMLFFGSGATALVYEVVWSKFLSQMFGSTIYAQTVVLAAFMGGLALGNKLLGRWADKLAQPLRTYGYLEIAIGVYAFLFPTLEALAGKIFVSIGSGILDQTLLLLGLKAVLSAALLLGPTILMGGTLPLVAAWLQKFSADAGRRSAMFYAINSLGAVTGAGVAGFWLVQNLGLISTLQITGLANVIIGATAGWLGTKQTFTGVPKADSGPEISAASNSPLGWRLACFVVALTGAVSMALEVLASRSLAMIFGSSLQSFAVVLMAFILGIGLGSAWMASARRKIADARLVVILLCVAAAWVTLLVLNIERWVDFYRIAQTGIARSSIGYLYHQGLTTGMALLVLGLPAACIGAVLPLMIRTVAGGEAHLGTRVGALLTANTLGAVVGVLLAGFVLMPVFGLRNAYAVLTLILALAALLLARRAKWKAGKVIAGTAGIFALALFLFGGEDWRAVISSGVFRGREKEFNPDAMTQRKQHTKILFYEDAADATVSVEQGDAVPGVPTSSDIGLRVNGKTDATSRVDLNTQMLLAHLPMLARPEAKDVFVFGLGSGISAGALRSYPTIEKIVIAENCEPVVRASRFFNEENRNILSDPRTKLWHEDARTVLKLSAQHYDAIVAEPSNPWTAGIGSVFSREFYELCAARLKPGGIMVQWFHLYEMHDGIVELVLRTFTSVFPHVEIWDSCHGDIILLGAQQPWASSPEIFAKSFALPGVKADFARLGVHSPEAIFARQLASQRTAYAITGPGPMQSDLFPVLEYAAPYAFYLGENSKMVENFDERTRQQLLAPAAKVSLLRSLPPEEIQSVFSQYTTVNTELLPALKSLLSAAETPCLLRTNAPMIAPLPVLGTNLVALSESVSRLGLSPAQTAQGLAGIEALLQTQPAGTNAVAAQWASLAATAALHLGDHAKTAQLVLLAQKFNPEDPQAAFLLRILAREAPQLFQK
jgi:predicted membrane-bound spermidine synthase